MQHFSRLAEEEPRGKRHYQKKDCVDQRKKTDVLLRVAGTESPVVGERDQARKRRDQGTRSSDIYP